MTQPNTLKALYSTAHPPALLSHSSAFPPVALCAARNAALLGDGKKHHFGLLSTTLPAHIPTPTEAQAHDYREI